MNRATANTPCRLSLEQQSFLGEGLNYTLSMLPFIVLVLGDVSIEQYISLKQFFKRYRLRINLIKQTYLGKSAITRNNLQPIYVH